MVEPIRRMEQRFTRLVLLPVWCVPFPYGKGTTVPEIVLLRLHLRSKTPRCREHPVLCQWGGSTPCRWGTRKPQGVHGHCLHLRSKAVMNIPFSSVFPRKTSRHSSSIGWTPPPARLWRRHTGLESDPPSGQSGTAKNLSLY